ncbi:MAG TPA: protease pro-enzyme activation domain-containing protein [Candidatus Binatia bacterium]|nr:protease pro-enzyme activation domain-containing protein [Candidatus Binatia bacterium]
MAAEDPERVVAAVAAADRRVVAAWVFGSRARGEARSGSDLDVAILTDGTAAGLADALAAEISRRAGLATRFPRGGQLRYWSASMAGHSHSLLTVLAMALVAGSSPAFAGTTRLPGHVLGSLGAAVPIAPTPGEERAPLTLTFVLRHDDQAGFERYLASLGDPASSHYRRYLTQRQIADRFGPSRGVYARLRRHLEAHGFAVVSESANRLTLTVRGTRAAAERLLDVRLADYRLGDRVFFANDVDPALPRGLAAHVQTVAGLANLARPQATVRALRLGFYTTICALALAPIEPPFGQKICTRGGMNPYKECLTAAKQAAENDTDFNFDFLDPRYQFIYNWMSIVGPSDPCPPGYSPLVRSRAAGTRPAVAASGAGQTVALVEFDTFDPSDVADYAALLGLPASQLDNLSQVHVGGGAAPGTSQDEVLLDIDTVMTIVPDAKIVVYDAPFSGPGSFQALFNAAISGGATVISNSWAYCEDQTSLADVQGIDAIFQNAAMSNVSIFNGAGDTGSTCLDGSPNTVAVPADAPHATAVGGSLVTAGQGNPYVHESWWDGSAATPPTGQGGFGVSRFFARPSYQDGLNPAANRSVPDVVANADPANGVMICQATAGGCPSGALYGGTSFSAPLWAAYMALVNQAIGHDVGFANAALYPLAGTAAFRNAAALGSDFAHVGLGSPDVGEIIARLGGQAIGVPDPGVSIASPALDTQVISGFDTSAAVPADGTSAGYVIVRLFDAGRHAVSGKTVTLTAGGGSHATIAPASAVSNADGRAVFTLTDLVAENVILTATDTTDGVQLTNTPALPFVVPAAASAGIGANPTNVTADGTSTTTITVTLEDALGRPTPGKEVTLSQGAGHSFVTGPSPSVTDGSGQIRFTATDQVNETVTYTAVDASDGDLPVPGSAVVTFGNGAGTACGNNAPPPTAAPGYALTPFAGGFASASLSYGGVNFGGCSGISPPGFLGASAFLYDFLNGDVFKLPATGGSASSASRLGTVGPTLGWPTFGPDGSLYATRAATTGNFTTGAVLQLDPATGGVLRAVASNYRCPSSLAVDPLSGDLFFDGECFGAGSDDPAIYRIRNPTAASPTVETYATLPSTPNGKLVFAPNGSLYVVTGYTGSKPPVIHVTGTNGPTPPVVTPLTGVTSSFWVNIGQVGADGEARSLITLTSGGDLQLTDITATPPTATPLAHGIGGGLTGPDGCLYAVDGTGTVVYKLGNADGSCSFAATNPTPSLVLTPTIVTPGPAQGSAQTFTATLENVGAALGSLAGTPVFFSVTGANPQVRMVRADASGRAALRYVGASQGRDLVIATATPGNTSLTSNTAQVTWTAGPHVTFLTLNPSPTAGVPGRPVGVVAALADVSARPPAPVGGATVAFALGGAHCSAATDGRGMATCPLTPAGLGNGTLTASFAGTSALLAASDAVGFDVGCGAGLGGVACYLDQIAAALEGAARGDVKKSVKSHLLHAVKHLTKLVQKAGKPGRRGAKALKALKHGLDGLAGQLQHLHGRKIGATLDAMLLTLARGARGAVP